MTLDPQTFDPSKFPAITRASAARAGAKVLTAMMQKMPSAAELPTADQVDHDALLVGGLALAVRSFLDQWDEARIVGLATTNGAGAALVLAHVETVRRALMTFEEEFAPECGAPLPPYCPPLESGD